LSSYRIVQRNLVYVIGLSSQLATEEVICVYQILRSDPYFGQYGKIVKTVVNTDKPFNPRGQTKPTFSAYITYSNDKEASLAILAAGGVSLHDNVIRTSYGTTKYCTFYIRDQTCTNPDCLYLHSKAQSSDIISKVAFHD
jgi:CCR4-NOT transcription complex subunit 4